VSSPGRIVSMNVFNLGGRLRRAVVAKAGSEG
jgi:hypothetical protein